jgi:dolichyl-phosphate beta-glucosyltransferase
MVAQHRSRRQSCTFPFGAGCIGPVRLLEGMAMNIALSVVLPAYNEAHRLPDFLAAVREYLEKNHPDSHEVIVVNDGSSDGTAGMLAQSAVAWPSLVVMSHQVNQGKGAAVRTGMLAARGEWMLFADADGATPIAESARLEEAIRQGADVAIGSRWIAMEGLVRKRTWLRRLAGRSFAALARWWLAIPQRDTQCGFKMFRRDAGRRLFAAGCETRYLFDLELLALARRQGFRVAEVPVSWHEVPGSHLSLSREWFRALLGLIRIRRRLRLGAP